MLLCSGVVMQKVNISAVILHGCITGIVFSIILTIAVFLTGATFGQRCSVKYEHESPQWKACLDRLSKGGEV